MTHFCTEPMDMIKDGTGNLHYVSCGQPATHYVPDSIYDEGYYLCPIHAEIGKDKKWTVQELKE